MGEVPDWYNDVRTADACGVDVWDLGKVPVYWQQRLIIARTAENQARNSK